MKTSRFFRPNSQNRPNGTAAREDALVVDPAEWFDGRGRVLFVHAHPDDETITTGGVLAALAAAGREPGLVTLTRGERGEAAPGPYGELQGTDGLARHREGELAAALAALGVDRHAFLGAPPARAAGLEPRVYRDSGMEWAADGLAAPAPDAGPEALTSADAVDPLTDLIAVADAWDAEAIVSYDALGGYRHPDHVLAHRLARAVAHGLELPFWEIVGPREPGAGEEGDAGGDRPEPGSHEPQPYDVSPWLDRKVAALRAHATQLTVDGDEIVHVGGQRQPVDRVEAFRRLR